MENRAVRRKLDRDELPDDFAYPDAFLAWIDSSASEDFLEPWGMTADPAANTWLSELFQRPLLQFAQAWHEDMIAAFMTEAQAKAQVLVVNPWAMTCIDGEWLQTGAIIETFPGFEAWLEWVRHSELVGLYAAQEKEGRGRTDD